MIGPGTGVAPFRAFLHERQQPTRRGATGCSSAISVSDCDFFYEDEFSAMHAAGHLTRLSLAWSRDGNDKVYVQHRMREAGSDYGPGSTTARTFTSAATRCAWRKDVETALTGIVAEHGGRTPAEAAKFIAELKANGRYQADVYRETRRRATSE